MAAEMKIRTRRKRKKRGSNLYSPDEDLKLDKDGFVPFSTNNFITNLRNTEISDIPFCAKSDLFKNISKNDSDILAEAALSDSIILPFDRHRPTSLSISSNSSENNVKEKITTNDSIGETEHVKYSNLIGTQSEMFPVITEATLTGNVKRGAAQSLHCTPRANALIKIKVEKRVAGNCPVRDRIPNLYKGVPVSQEVIAPSQSSSDSYSVEEEVLGLMAEMQEATKEIKQDVRQLRNSETPTPDTPTPLREFRDFLNREEEQEVGRLPTISEMIRESEEDGAMSSLAGEDDFSSVKNSVGLSSIPTHYNALLLPFDRYPDSQLAGVAFPENSKNSNFQMSTSRLQHSKMLSKNCLSKWRQLTAKRISPSYEWNKCEHGESFQKHWCDCNTCIGDWNHNNKLRNDERNRSMNNVNIVPEVAPVNNSQNRLITQLLQSLSCSNKNAICERHSMIENAAKQVSAMLSALEVEIQCKRTVNIECYITQLDDLKLSLQSMPTTTMLKSY